jgi:hypothetical protein
MAKLNNGTVIYGTANVYTAVYVGQSNNTTGTGGINTNTTTLFIGNNTVNAYLNTIGLNVNNATIANTLGVYTTGTINAASHTVGTSFTANSTAITLGTTAFVANSINLSLGSIFVANSINLSLGSIFVANSTQLTITTPTAANGSVGTAGYILASNGATGSPYWRDTVRVNTQVSSASVTIDATLYDTYVFTALATGLTFNASTSATNGDKIIIRIKDDGTARALTWTGTGSAGGFRPIGLTLPSTTTVSKTLYVGLVYNTDGATALWDAIAYTIEA